LTGHITINAIATHRLINLRSTQTSLYTWLIEQPNNIARIQFLSNSTGKSAMPECVAAASGDVVALKIIQHRVTTYYYNG